MESKPERLCSWCGKKPPEGQTDSALSGPVHGWRVTRKRLEDGAYEVAWHCPECWCKLKESGGSPYS